MADKKPIVAITGAGDGIGWATAQVFAGRGYRVALLDINVDAASARAAELGDRHAGIRCDVSDEADVRAALRDGEPELLKMLHRLKANRDFCIGK